MATENNTNTSLRYIAIEGMIGVGKTVLATKLTEKLQARLVLEEVEENPFLANFYQDMRTYALSTQLFFLLSRHRQQQQLSQQTLFEQRIVSDYCFIKDRVFAYMNLSYRSVSLIYSFKYTDRSDYPFKKLSVYTEVIEQEYWVNCDNKVVNTIFERGQPYHHKRKRF